MFLSSSPQRRHEITLKAKSLEYSLDHLYKATLHQQTNILHEVLSPAKKWKIFLLFHCIQGFTLLILVAPGKHI